MAEHEPQKRLDHMVVRAATGMTDKVMPPAVMTSRGPDEGRASRP